MLTRDKLVLLGVPGIRGRLRGMRNYNATFAVGATNLQQKDHTKIDMHTKAMSLPRKNN